MNDNLVDSVMITNKKISAEPFSVEKATDCFQGNQSSLKGYSSVLSSTSLTSHLAYDNEMSQFGVNINSSKLLSKHCESLLHAASSQESEIKSINHDIGSCSSPESGFGSEYQHSPTNSSNMPQFKLWNQKNSNGSFSTCQKKLISPEFIQIVSVKSLAQDQSTNAKTNSCYKNCNAKRKSQGYNQIDGAKRLFLCMDGNKTVLRFNANLSTETEINLPKVEVNLPLSENTPHLQDSGNCVHFCGLPVITKRHQLTLNKHNITLFVSNLLQKNHKRLSLDTQTPIKDAVVSPKCCVTSEALTSGTLTTNTDTVISPAPSKKTNRTCHEDKKTAQSDIIDSTDLHSSSTCVEVKKPLKKQLQVKYSRTSYATKSPSIAVATTSSPSKFDKIKRLKEIIKQREEDLQKVRKTCGFIN